MEKLEPKKKKKISFGILLLLIVIGSVISVEATGIIIQELDFRVSSAETWVVEPQTIDISPITNLRLMLNNPLGLYIFLAVLIVYAFIIMGIRMYLNKANATEDDPRGFKIFKKGTYGTSGWMSKEEIAENFEICPPTQTNGTILGKDGDSGNVIALGTNAPVNKHIAVYGASGTGKSRRFVRNMIIQCVKRKESLIMTDPKGELYNDTAGYLMGKGYNVKVLDLVDPSFSDSWNVLSSVTNAPDEQKILNAQTLADVIIQNTSQGSGGKDPFWDNAEANLLKGLALLIAMDDTIGPEKKTMGRLYEILSGDKTEMENMFNKLKDFRTPTGEPHPAMACWNIHMQASEQVRGNVVIGLAIRIQVFQSAEIKNMTSFDICMTDEDRDELNNYNNGELKNDYGHLSYPKMLDLRLADPDGGVDLYVGSLVMEMRASKLPNKKAGEKFKTPKLLKLYNEVEKSDSDYSKEHKFDAAVIKYIMRHEGCIDLEEPAKTPCAYFLIMSDQQSTLNFLSSLFFTFLFIDLVKFADVYGAGGGKIDPQTGKRKRTGACDVPVNFILDEFPNIGQIPDFTKKLSTIRSRDLRVDVIFQNIAQLQNRYPDGLWEEIIGNCDTQLFLGCTDATTAKFISERTGTMTIQTESESKQYHEGQLLEASNGSRSNAQGKREVLTPDEVLRLDGKYALIILRSQKVLKCKKFDYSEHPESQALDSDKVDINQHVSVSTLIKQQELKDDDEQSDLMAEEAPIGFDPSKGFNPTRAAEPPVRPSGNTNKNPVLDKKAEAAIDNNAPVKPVEKTLTSIEDEKPLGSDPSLALEKLQDYKRHSKKEYNNAMDKARAGKSRRDIRLRNYDPVLQKILVPIDD